MLSLPKNTNSQAAKIYQNLSKPYTGLADVFKTGIENEANVTELITEAQVAQQVFVDECNSGLVRQVIHAYRQFSVQRLGKTYAALTIAEVTIRTSDNSDDHAETGQYVIRLISAGQLNANICQTSEDPATWILRFSNSSEDGPHARSEEQQHEDLMRQAEKIQAVVAHVKEADRKYGLSKEYIQEAKRVKKGKEAGTGHEDGNPWIPAADGFDHDEDMMAGL